MKSRGFTLVELLVSVGIFAMMTALIVAKYGNFNSGVLLTNLAYDVALTIRTAQTYGLNVRNVQQGGTAQFQSAYGVNFNPGASFSCAHSNSTPTQFVMFADSSQTPPNDNKCDVNDTLVSSYVVKRGAIISNVCAGAGTCTLGKTNSLDITFKRPDPSANICFNGACGLSYAQIEVKAVDGGTRIVEVRDTGQISVKN